MHPTEAETISISEKRKPYIGDEEICDQQAWTLARGSGRGSLIVDCVWKRKVEFGQGDEER